MLVSYKLLTQSFICFIWDIKTCLRTDSETSNNSSDDSRKLIDAIYTIQSIIKYNENLDAVYDCDIDIKDTIEYINYYAFDKIDNNSAFWLCNFSEKSQKEYFGKKGMTLDIHVFFYKASIQKSLHDSSNTMCYSCSHVTSLMLLFYRWLPLIIELKLHWQVFWFRKLLILQGNQKDFLISPVYKQMHVGHKFKEKQHHIHFFFQNKPFKEWMKKFIALLTKEKLLRMNLKVMSLTFFELYTVYTKNNFFHTDSLNCLKKDSSVLLKVINIWAS